MKLEGQIAIVTGAASGIGRATAIELARHGAAITVNDVSQTDDAEEVVRTIEASGGRAISVRGNVADRASAETLVGETVAAFGRVDILVNNAGFSIRKPLLELEVADLELTWGVCLWGVFHCSQLAARQMVRQGTGGSIVMISSVHAFRPYPEGTAYNAAKAAVNQMAYTWAGELAPHGIRVNVVEPGWTDTPGERRYATEEQIREGGALVPLGRLARPEEIARGVLFLVSQEDSSYVTGSCLRIDGGLALAH